MSYQSLWGDVHQSSFEQGYVDADGVRTRYIRAGDRASPKLIFLHGTGGHAEAFLRNLDAHAAHFDTVLIDYLGHGWTDKPDVPYEMPQYCAHLAATMDAFGFSSASICGESMGGWIAAWFAIHYPDRVDRLVLNTMGGATMNPQVMKTVYDKTLAAVEDPFTHTRPRLEWLMADPSMVTDDLVACRERIYAQPGMKEAMLKILCLQVEEPRRRNLMTQENMSRIKAPTLVIWTSKDPTASTETGAEIASWIPGSEFAVMDNCGHWPQYEKPDVYNGLSLGFLLRDGIRRAA